MAGNKKSTWVDSKSLQALSRPQARLLEAVSARIFPTTDTPGAVEAGAVTYIDRALAGAYRSLFPLYRKGLRGMNRHALDTLGRPFLDITEAEQDRVLKDFESGQVSGFRESGEFFRILRRHVLEGVFGEPSYGGNRDMVGWILVGFPGQRYGYEDAYINRVVDLPPVASDGEPVKSTGKSKG